MSRRGKHEPFHWLLAGLSWLGSLLGLGGVGYLGEWLALQGFDMAFLIASFGASAVLLYCAPSVPYSQPRNVLGGQIFSAFVGVTAYQAALPLPLWSTAVLAVTASIAVMQLTRTLHPPGGGTALAAVLSDEHIHAMGYWYVLSPVALGTLVMLAVALLVNNLPRSRRYPLTWF
ncbi:MAG: HPP family protein [Methylococcaceae bacterium]|nr:MAG: HPP family protein [Methylococcaceae bacterium]